MKNILEEKQIINSIYEVQFFVSGNSFFELYRVRKNDGKICLLKLYDSSKLSRFDFSNGNLLEVEILSSINLENVNNLIDNGEFIKNDEKYNYIVLDFISGETLQDKLEREGAFSQYFAVPLIIYILETLKNIHKKSNPVIHNNINPSNIYLDYSHGEKPVITGFNFARYMTSKRNSINLSQLSPFYIAPELFNGISTPHGDIFSVGALLYNLVVGTPPWYEELPKGVSKLDQVIDFVNEQRKHELNFGLDGIKKIEDNHLIDVITKALEIRIDDRFKNVNEFIGALKGETVLLSSDEENGEAPQSVKKKGPGFSAIAGMQKLKTLLYNDVIRAFKEKELYESYGITIPNGMLLYGPPGCGKTFICEKLAEEVGFNFLKLLPSDIKSKYINATEEKIGEIFKEAASSAPTIIFIDEIDAVVPIRESSLNQMQSAPVNEFLAQMSNCSEKDIFVIAASNRPDKIDPAILRTGRIDKICYLPPPDFESRVAMFKLYLKKRPIDLGLNYERLAELTSNYVSSDIKFLVDEASRLALETRARITQEIFDKVISETNPSISISELQKYEKLKDKLENTKQSKEPSESRRPVGFR